MYFGLTSEEVRKLAYEFALKNGKPMRINWHEHSAAGLDWFQGFMSCHREISVRLQAKVIPMLLPVRDRELHKIITSYLQEQLKRSKALP